MNRSLEGWAALAGLVTAGMAWAPTVASAPCLGAGDSTTVQGASVATFMSLGIDPTVTCIENSLWQDPAGFTLGSYIKGADGMGGTPDPTALGFDGSSVDNTFAGNANARDFFWVQDSGNAADFGSDALGAITGGRQSQGIIWDLGGQANQAVVFVQVDHLPLPGEALENTAWLSNDPNTPDGDWKQALLDHVYLQGWSPDPDIADGFVAVYRLPNNAMFRYVSVTHGGPGSVHRDGDNEVDAVGGLTAEGGCVGCTPLAVPEPASGLLLVAGLLGYGVHARRVRPLPRSPDHRRVH